ncbi:cerebellar degeneration-related protein 2-like [Periophthalmus magnuspinnatus]|uniref:cerebellar degeneration-related protein 2-like n=1 Tax=Periophthalmus magnuspinnatus TaxID=409849 RepID=UPI00145AFCA5|nr:cerebellar degeneration-related protein 2-like [Periophthalmus magnuspinnatus]
MLADMIMEEEFEIKDEEPWYDKQDLEHDLHLAAELGKNLLERNRELEQGLGQMYSTNQEQLQQIEYLSKQVEILREVNDQHAKVYEQLDSSARDLEQNNLKLSSDNRTAQNKIQGLTETVEVLQTQVELLQKQVEDLKIGSSLKTLRQTGGRQSISCLQELEFTRRLRSCPLDESDAAPPAGVCWHEEQKEALTETLQTLQRQLANERSRRERAEHDAEILANENATLEQQLATTEGWKTRIIELEQEADELRQLWKFHSSSRSPVFDANFLDEAHSDSSHNSRLLKRSGSERAITKPAHFLESPDDHACSCVRRHDAFKYRGISLLNEVDAQYSALQVKYEELLSRCQSNTLQEEMIQSEAGIDSRNSNMADFEHLKDDMHQPEYKELFREIFQRIQKTKEDLIENRGRGMSGGGE